MTYFLIFVSLVMLAFILGWRQSTGRAIRTADVPYFDWVIVAYLGVGVLLAWYGS